MKVFITRSLNPDSPLRALQEMGVALNGYSLLKFIPLAFDIIPASDWIFFYSKTGVRFFFEHIRDREMAIDPGMKIAAIGPGTAQAIKSYGHLVHFEGTGDPVETAGSFDALPGNASVTFVRARQSKHSVKQYLRKTRVTYDLVVYDNVPDPVVLAEEADIVVVTSSMNARACFSKGVPDLCRHVIAIGNPTAETLRGMKIPCTISPSPDEAAILSEITRILGKSNFIFWGA